MLSAREYRRFSHVRDYGERLAAIWAADPGCMPYGRYRGQPVAVVLRDPSYLSWLEDRWNGHLPDPPEMIAQIRALKAAKTVPSRRVEREQRGDCVIYWPAIWQRHGADSAGAAAATG